LGDRFSCWPALLAESQKHPVISVLHRLNRHEVHRIDLLVLEKCCVRGTHCCNVDAGEERKLTTGQSTITEPEGLHRDRA
jgi:hypothetical protein